MGNYKKMIQTAYEAVNDSRRGGIDKMEYLGSYVFDLNTGDFGEGSALEYLTKIIIEASDAILNLKTFEYIKDENNYLKYHTAVNLPFLSEIIEYGRSIRGAWFDNHYDEVSMDCGRIIVKEGEIKEFIKDMFEWIKENRVL